MQYPVYNEQFTLDSVEFIPISVCNVLYFVHFKLYTVQGQVSTGHCLVLQPGLAKKRVFFKKPSPAGFFGFYWVLLGFIGFYWVFLGFIDFDPYFP